MELLVDKNKILPDNGLYVTVPIATEQVQQVSIKEIVEKGSRLLLRCHTMIRNKERFSPEIAFDELRKLLFIKIVLVKDPNGEIAFFYDLEHIREVQSIFDAVKKHPLCGGIFKDGDKLRLAKATANQILWELNDIDIDFNNHETLGKIYENFLTRILKNTMEYLFTPRSIIDYIIDVLEPKEYEKICDPCCGSGGFLVKSYEYLKNAIKDKKLNTQEEEIMLDRLNKECIFGMDNYAPAAEIAKLNMIMQGNADSMIYVHDGLKNIGAISNGQFDVVMINPPFGESLKEEAYTNQLSISFIQRGLDLLKPGGRMAIVLLEDVLVNNKYKLIRRYVESCAKIIKITSLPSGTFNGNNTKLNILFLNKFATKEQEKYNDARLVTEFQIAKKYAIDLECIENQLNVKQITKEEKQKLRNKKSQLQLKIEEEVDKIIKTNFDYKVLFADIENTGIRVTGYSPEEDDLLLLINEYIAYKKNTENNKWKLLQIANYSEMVNWSVRYLKNKIIEKDERQYSFMKLNDLLVRNREYITIENSNEYKRVTVKLNNNGVVLRDKVRGYDIGTKKQFKISKGQLIISKIGASDGAIGIVPNDLDKAIVTSDFLTYTVNTKFVLPEYLEFLIATSDFKTYLEQLNRGTTIPRLNEDLFLNTLIPVPSLEEQSVLSKKIFNLKKQLNKLETSLADEREKFKKTMFSK